MTSRARARTVLVRYILPSAFVALLVVYVLRRRSSFESLSDIGIGPIVLVAALTAVGHFLNAEEFGLLYRLMGAPIGVGENWQLYAAGQLGNLVPGQLGTVFRFRYVKSVHGLSYTDATAAYGANLAITVFATGLAGTFGCIALGIGEGTWSILLLAVLGGLMAVAVVAAVLPVSDRERESKLGRLWTRFGRGWHRARSNSRITALVLGLELARHLLLAWRLQITFSWVGTDEPIFFFLIIGPIGALATFVGFTPAAIGIREFAIAAATVALGRTFEEGLLGSAADRAIGLVVVLLTGVPGAIISTRRLRRAAVPAAG